MRNIVEIAQVILPRSLPPCKLPYCNSVDLYAHFEQIDLTIVFPVTKLVTNEKFLPIYMRVTKWVTMDVTEQHRGS